MPEPKLRFRLPDSHPSGLAYQSQSTAYLRSHLILASSVLFIGITLCAVPSHLETGLCVSLIAGLLFALIQINNPLRLLDKKAVVRYENEHDLIFDKDSTSLTPCQHCAIINHILHRLQILLISTDTYLSLSD